MMTLQELKAKNMELIKHEAVNNVTEAKCRPTTLILSPSQKCNFRCRTCSQTHGNDELPTSTLNKLKSIMPYVTVLDFVGGEPLLLDSFKQIIGWGSRYQCRLETVTNGVLLTEEWREAFVDNLSNVRISIDGATPKTYEYVRRNPHLYRVLKNMTELALLKAKRNSPTPIIEINFVAMKANIRELPRLVAMAGELGVDQVNVIYMLAHNEELARQSLFFIQEESDICMRKAVEVGEKAGVYVRIPELFSEVPKAAGCASHTPCAGPWHFLGVDADGSAKICCGGAPSFGNLNTLSVDEFWQIPALQQLRRTVNTPDEPEYCKNCAHDRGNTNRIRKHILVQAIAVKIAAEMGVDLQATV